MSLAEYIEAHSSPEGAVLEQITRNTHLEVINPRMLSGHVQGRVLSMLSKMIRPKRILELGTFTGYSALCLAEGLTEDGKLITIEHNDEMEEAIRRNLALSPLGKKIELVIGDAKEWLEIAAKAAVDGRSATPVDGRTPQSHSDSSPINKGAEEEVKGERLEVKGERLEEKATLSELGWAIVGFLAFAAAMGGIVLVVQWLLHGWQATMGMVIYAILGLIIGINYSGKPLELGYHGLGELVIGMMFGPLLMLGVQAALTGTPFTWEMLCMSVGIGCMVTNIVYVHSVMEVNADAELGKMTFARLLFEAKSIGTPQSHSDSSPINKGAKRGERLMVIFIGVFAMMPFVMLGLGIAMGWWSAWYLLTLATLPMSVYLIHSTRLFAYGLPREDTPHWWMGPMGNWEGYKKVGIDWFLYRWLLARNICTFFCLILMIVCLVLR